ncbi:ABC transporter ATP-binding protein [Pukyongiella litopenaei]|uniref:ATP-binding cassette domain-containing protein n=1 Tax=Pukyongiella litopenaei TaxID=2605946 RepID=A0A2S0MU42_9RHOB|nr:ATP-binding cassette domain-containing protein [Pukyongiella litopenaei]AVO39416.1 ATP-binding cassette domain-containing protein [Pukyongiella litopenaei]
MISVRNLSYAVGGTPILSEVTVDIVPGRITALIGPNGAGKSTLLAQMARLLRPDTGNVTLDGTDVHQVPTGDLARRLAILRQEQGQPSRMTVRELVGFGRFPHHRGRVTARDRTHVDTALERLSLTEFAGRYFDTLSGGQKQRVLIAMVLCQDTEVVLLDEPMNNLDPAQVQVVMGAVDHMSQALGKTVVVVLHDLNHAAGLASQVVAMKAGRVFAKGETDRILNRPLLERLYDAAFDVLRHDGRPIVVPKAGNDVSPALNVCP